MQKIHPKTWLFIVILAGLLMGAALIIKHHYAVLKEENQLQQNIDNHSEIKDTV
jgi:hypothetical protein